MADPRDELLDELRTVLRSSDPVPASVTDFAKEAFGWRRLDADLAELLEDSALASEAAPLARGGDDRMLTFRSADLTIDVSLQGGMILGQLAPPGPATVELQADDTSVTASTETDALGRFRLEPASGARVRLRIQRHDATGPPVETSWFSI